MGPTLNPVMSHGDGHPMEPHGDKRAKSKKKGPKRGAPKRQGDRSPCGNPAGFKTNHPGIGRCKLHGGNAPIKHGRYSAVVRAIAKEQHLKLYEEIRAKQEMASLHDETALLRTILAALPDIWPDKSAAGRPQQAMAATQLVEAIGKTVTRHAQIQQAQSLIVTARDLEGLIDLIGGVLVRTIPQRALLDLVISDLRQEITRRLGHSALPLPEGTPQAV